MTILNECMKYLFHILHNNNNNNNNNGLIFFTLQNNNKIGLKFLLYILNNLNHPSLISFLSHQALGGLLKIIADANMD